MKRATSALLAALVIVVAVSGCSQPAKSRLPVATSTTLMGYIVQQVGGDSVDVLNIVPASQHPGNFDAKPSDIEKLARAKLFLVHGFPGETYVPAIIKAANNPDLKLLTISDNRSWMTPEVQIAAADMVAVALSDADPPNKSAYEARAKQYKDRVAAKATAVRAKLSASNVATLKAISSGFQAPFAAWAGVKVVGTYLTQESLTLQFVQDLEDKGKAQGVNVVIDNVHSGAEIGKGIAEDLKAKHIVLVYFPGGLPNTETWEKAIDYDVSQLVEAAK